MQPPPQTEGTDVAIAVFMVDCRMSHDINEDEEQGPGIGPKCFAV